MKFRAFAILCLVSALLGGCQKKTPEQLLQQAVQQYASADRTADSVRATGGDMHAYFQPSIDAFEKVASEYPGSEQAEKALITLAEIRGNGTREPEKAVETYRRYLEAFPEGQMAPRAMFLIGYIYNNELHNSDSAAAAYHRFLDRFPQSEMASSAQFELQNLGKTPEELLPRGEEENPATAERPHRQQAASKRKSL